MFALFLKDILSLKKTLRLYAIFLVVYSVIGVFTDNSAFFLTFIVLLGMMLPLSAMTLDAACHWNRYAACLPMPRTAQVTSKYLLSVFGILFALLPTGVLMGLHVAGLLPKFALGWPEISLMVTLGLLILAFQMPFLFWFGPERGRFVSIAILLLFCLGIPFLVMQSDIVAVDETFVQHLITHMAALLEAQPWLPLAAALVCNLVSACISSAIFSRKEID